MAFRGFLCLWHTGQQGSGDPESCGGSGLAWGSLLCPLPPTARSLPPPSHPQQPRIPPAFGCPKFPNQPKDAVPRTGFLGHTVWVPMSPPTPSSPAWRPRCSGSPKGSGASPERLAGSKGSGVGGWGAHANHLIPPKGLGPQMEPLGIKPQLFTHPFSGKNCSSLNLAPRPGWGHPRLLPAIPTCTPSTGHTRNPASGSLSTPRHTPALPAAGLLPSGSPGAVRPPARGAPQTLSSSLDPENRRAGDLPPPQPPHRSGHHVTALR